MIWQDKSTVQFMILLKSDDYPTKSKAQTSLLILAEYFWFDVLVGR